VKTETTTLQSQTAKQVWRLNMLDVLPVLQQELLGWLGQERLRTSGKGCQSQPPPAATETSQELYCSTAWF